MPIGDTNEVAAAGADIVTDKLKDASSDMHKIADDLAKEGSPAAPAAAAAANQVDQASASVSNAGKTAESVAGKPSLLSRVEARLKSKSFQNGLIVVLVILIVILVWYLWKSGHIRGHRLSEQFDELNPTYMSNALRALGPGFIQGGSVRPYIEQDTSLSFSQ